MSKKVKYYAYQKHLHNMIGIIPIIFGLLFWGFGAMMIIAKTPIALICVFLALPTYIVVVGVLDVVINITKYFHEKYIFHHGTEIKANYSSHYHGMVLVEAAGSGLKRIRFNYVDASGKEHTYKTSQIFNAGEAEYFKHLNIVHLKILGKHCTISEPLDLIKIEELTQQKHEDGYQNVTERICTHCGAKVPDDANFCSQCGSKSFELKYIAVKTFKNKKPTEKEEKPNTTESNSEDKKDT